METEIEAIGAVHNIGALSLSTHELKKDLKAAVAAWKIKCGRARGVHAFGVSVCPPPSFDVFAPTMRSHYAPRDRVHTLMAFP